METYNYSQFKTAHYRVPEFLGPKAGENYVEMKVHDLQGNPVELSQYLGKRPVVLETASLTSPSYVQSLPKMRRLMQLYPDVLFLVLYVREAHPGSLIRPHKSLGSKLMAARQLVGTHQESRTVLVDTLEGQAHRDYGGLPNMVYLFDTEGKVAFRGDWNRPEHLAYVLKRMMAGRQVFRRDYFKPAKPKPWATWKALRFAGWPAIWNFLKNLPGMCQLSQEANLKYSHRALLQ